MFLKLQKYCNGKNDIPQIKALFGTVIYLFIFILYISQIYPISLILINNILIDLFIFYQYKKLIAGFIFIAYKKNVIFAFTQ